MADLKNNQPDRAEEAHEIPDGMGLITVVTGYPGQEITEAFFGKWLIKPAGHGDAIALTANGRIAVYFQHFHTANDGTVPATLADFDDLDEAAEIADAELLSMAARKMGEDRPVFRDI